MEQDQDRSLPAQGGVTAARSDSWNPSYDAGKKAFELGAYTEAVEHFETALKGAESFGFHDARFIATLDGLAGAYAGLGRHTEAEEVYVRALSLQEAVSDPRGAGMARTLNGLGALQLATGRIEKAEASYRRALEVQGGAQGSEDLSLATTLNNLALLYKGQQRFSEALPLFERALRIVLKASGPDHPFVATALNNIGTICVETGRYGQAEALFKQALEIKERVHGSDHPEVATILNNLGDLYCAAGRPGEARPVYERVLASDGTVYGANHPEVAADLMQLGSVCQTCGDVAAAREHYHRAWEIRKSSLGARHGLTQESRKKFDELSISESSAAASSAETAKPQQVGELITAGAAERGLGRPAAAQSLCELAERCAREMRWTEAERIYRRELEIEQSVAGPSAPCVAATLNNIGYVRQRQGGAEDAAGMFQDSLGAWLSAAKPPNALASIALNNLAALCAARSRYAEAESLYARSLQIEADSSSVSGEYREVIAANLAALRKPAGHISERSQTP